MIQLSILETEIKSFMQKLLKESVFDQYEVRGFELVSFTKIEISGILDRDFLEEDQKQMDRKYCTWSELKPYVLPFIKGKKPPKSLKIVFCLDTQTTPTIHENAGALFLNVLYEAGVVGCTTATAQKEFSLDKSLDTAWDEYVKGFFKAQGILY